MKHLFFTTMVLINTLAGYSQQTEFPVYTNGLVYSDTTMKQLKFIVDSLNLKFKRCDLDRKYYTIKQGLANRINLYKTDSKPALADILNGISYADFIHKYKNADIDTGILLTESDETDYKNRSLTSYRLQRPDERDENIDVFRDTCTPDNDNKYSTVGARDNWVYEYSKPGENSTASLTVFYITQTPASTIIPDNYAKIILYSDCMIDTTADIYLPDAQRDGWRIFDKDKKNHPKLDLFNTYLEKNTANLLKKYHLAKPQEQEWLFMDSLTKQYVEDSLSPTPVFKQLLSDAAGETLALKTIAGDNFEYYTAQYYSKAAALTMKRSRHVVGGCSMDQAPRWHAIGIAMLAAQTVNWEVFLRAHLDIMNDRFDRVSDGSYAWGARKTYIKEIEDLDIDVQDLMLGISLRVANPSGNHYFGDIGRLGRAFAETKNRPALEQQLLSMIEDNRLDTYNRLLMHFLFMNYMYYLQQKEDRRACLEKLEAADKSLPPCLSSRIKINKKVFEEGSR